MRTLRILLLHELRSLAIAAPTYIAAGLFLSMMGFLYLMVLHEAKDTPLDLTPVQMYFSLFFVPLFLIVPLLTMRSFADEYRNGTLAALFSTPVRPAQVVFAKFASAYIFYLLLWALALLYPLVAWWMLGPLYSDPRLLDLPALIGGGVFVAASGAFYVAVGILASSLTRSTLVAALLTVCALFFLVLLGFALRFVPLDTFAWGETVLQISDYFNTVGHLGVYLRGIADSQPLFLFLSGTLLSLALASLAVESKT
ncbi:MAG: ABC transporter permease [Puniceicoccales bacterium]|jgi:ABC-2 type transport system permease protein|nr:ABC transporter permease [Puniceicoccales bacterium]